MASGENDAGQRRTMVSWTRGSLGLICELFATICRSDSPKLGLEDCFRLEPTIEAYMMDLYPATLSTLPTSHIHERPRLTQGHCL